MIDTLVFEQQFKEIILEAGVFLRTTFTDFDAKKVEKKGLNDLVSYADKECENVLVNGLKNLLNRNL